ncbi:arginine--tRNA ligase [Longispora fulva]|uniref:arginine--tRNA ligase n=1 Tax=Longispora fulva TaxID=619741 RepID=UPI0018CA110D|nr:arginine--tRNA ligase [Longispora fulva]
MNLEELLTERLARAFEAVAGDAADPVVRRSTHADFQVDGVLPLARRLGRPPRDVAADVLLHADLDGLATAAISGPGYINLRVADTALGALLATIAADERLGVPRVADPDIVPIDYSAPNVAKEMHVGHLRSTVIGDAAARLLSWLGHDVIRANHLGDWGTPFGMLIEHLLDLGDAGAAHELSVGDLSGLYQAARLKFDDDEDFAERARERVVVLQSGDEATLALWRRLVTESERYFLSVYDKLGVTLTSEDFRGESFYNDRLEPLVEELDHLGLLRVSGRTRCVFPAGFVNRDEEPMPIIVRKRDGGFGYGATDLATIRYRTQELKATRLLYVVGLPQRQHFEMVYQTAREAGWLADPVTATHVGFGSVLGPDGKMLRTRAGGTVKLVELLDEAVSRAENMIGPDVEPDARAELARAVGIGAVKYADLSTDRVKDYVFDWDRMLAFEGNTAPYLQYAHTRIRSIFRKGGMSAPREPQTVIVTEDAERALALQLLAFGGVVHEVAESLRFHKLTTYLYGVATAFTRFYEHCPVLRSAGEVRDSRLVLCDLTARTLARGLDLLGIATPDRM